VVDTSGSVSDRDLSIAAAAAVDCARSYGADVRLTGCDTRCGKWSRVRRASDLPETWVGGGGTDMATGIHQAIDAHPRAAAVVVITDGYTPWPVDPIRRPVVVAVITGESRHDSTPEWIDSVEVCDD